MDQRAGFPKEIMKETTKGSGQNPYVFIVGCPRSGTTLLRRMVDANPRIAIIHETRWIDSWFEERISLTPEGHVTPELIPRLLEHPRFSELEIGREQVEQLLASDEPTSYSSFITGIFDLYGEARGKQLVGDKSPRYVRSLPTLHTLWPKAKFVHIIRDGRDVCLSAINWRSGGELARRFSTWKEDPVATAAVWWDWLVRMGREDGRVLEAGLYHEVRYESLVSQPADECGALCEFLDIPYDEVMLRFHAGRTWTKPGRDPRRNAKKHWLPVTSGLRDWSTEMSAEDIERFEAAAGDLLDELGYPRGAPHPSSEALRTTSLVRDSFAREVLAGGERLPKPWKR